MLSRALSKTFQGEPTDLFSRQRKKVRRRRPVSGVWNSAVLVASSKPDMYTRVYAVWGCPRNYVRRRLGKLFKERLNPAASEVYETYRFHTRVQNTGGKVSKFLADLRSVTDHRAFGTAVERNLRERFMIKQRENTARKMLPPKLKLL